jgi:hypothetical protein
MVFSLGFGWAEEADDAMGVKGISSTAQTPFRQTCLLRSFCWRNADTIVEADDSYRFAPCVLAWLSASL